MAWHVSEAPQLNMWHIVSPALPEFLHRWFASISCDDGGATKGDVLVSLSVGIFGHSGVLEHWILMDPAGQLWNGAVMGNRFGYLGPDLLHLITELVLTV